MDFWLVQDGASSVDVTPSSRHLVLRSARKARIERGDQLVLLRRNVFPSAFTHVAKVQDVRFQEIATNDGPLVITRLIVDGWRALENQTTIDVLRYSLTIIRNFERPDLYFRKGYRRLPEEDFDTITKGEPFVARTTYFELLSALPPSTRRTFDIERSFQDFNLWERRSFADRAEYLYAFIRERVIAAGGLVMALANLIDSLELRSENDQPLSHGLSEEGSSRRDDIRVQAAAFENLAGLLRGAPAADKGQSDLDVVEIALREARSSDRRDVEQRFEAIFRGRQ